MSQSSSVSSVFHFLIPLSYKYFPEDFISTGLLYAHTSLKEGDCISQPYKLPVKIRTVTLFTHVIYALCNPQNNVWKLWCVKYVNNTFQNNFTCKIEVITVKCNVAMQYWCSCLWSPLWDSLMNTEIKMPLHKISTDAVFS
jgi:hypothetical protein